MKKIILILLLFSLVLSSFVSCKKDVEDDTDRDQSGENDKGDGSEEELPRVDFFNDDLSEFIEIDEKYYKNYTVLVDPDRVTQFDIENKIISILYKYKSTEPTEADGIISVGDTVDIFYKGYYMDADKKVYFSGGSNYGGSAYSLGIGSAGFIPGFEYNMIGKNPADYSADNPMIIEAYFPENYSNSAELAGKTAYFEVYVAQDTDGKYRITEYSVPEFDDTFIRETLKVDADTLGEYEGETLTEKYRDYIKEQYMKENGLDIDTLIENAFWESILEGAVIKKYPEGEVKSYYNSYVSEIEMYYAYYSGIYEYDEFMCLYIGLDVGSDWSAYLTEMAKSQIKRLLAFYHVANVSGLKPTDEEYERMFDEYLVSSLENNDVTPDDFESEEAYLTAKENYKNELIKSKGEDYFKSMIYYESVIAGIKSYANIVEK